VRRLPIGDPLDPEVRPGLPDTPLGRRLRQHRAAVLEAAGRHGASNLRVFGSVARAEDSSASDIDLLVDLAPGTGLVALGTLERELSEILGCRVDLAPSDSLRPQVKAEAEAEAIPL
jgi:predicted nucleotidyltransferase